MHDARPLSDRRRFWRLMQLMVAVAAAGVIGVLLWLRSTGVPMPFHFVTAVSLGVAASVLLAGLLMGLAFLSSRSGHDATIGRDEDENSL